MEWICRMVLGATEGTGSVATLQLSFIAGVQLAEVGGTLRCVEEDLAPTVVAAGAGATAAPADPSPVHALAWARCVGCYAQLQRVLADAESSLHQPPWMSDRVLEAVAKPLACPVDTRELDGWTAVWDDATAGYYFAHLATGVTSWDVPAVAAVPLGQPALSLPQAEGQDPASQWLHSIHVHTSGLTDASPGSVLGTPLALPTPSTAWAHVWAMWEVLSGLLQVLQMCEPIEVRAVAKNHALITFTSTCHAAYAYWCVTGVAPKDGAGAEWREASLQFFTEHATQRRLECRWATLADSVAGVFEAPSFGSEEVLELPASDFSGGEASTGEDDMEDAEAVAAVAPAPGVEVIVSAPVIIKLPTAPPPPPVARPSQPALTMPTPGATALFQGSRKRRVMESLMDKWRNISAEESNVDVNFVKKRIVAAEEWRLQYIKSGASKNNANFVPVQRPDD